MISTEARGPVDVLVLDRPERRNALVPALADALAERLREIGATGRPIVLTGAGSAFCVGADLYWLGALDDPAEGVAEMVAAHHAVVSAMLHTPVPIIAAINGPAAGGGLSLALAADYRVASTRATFTAAYFKLGLTPDGGSSLFLVRAIGLGRTMELLLTNRRLLAEEAAVWGLVNEVAPEAHLLEYACQAAERMLALEIPAATLLASRKLLDTTGLEAQLQRESVAIRTAARQPAFRKALRAFLEDQQH